MADVIILWKIMNNENMCPYCKKPLYDHSKNITSVNDIRYNNSEKVIDVTYKGSKYTMHDKCFVALQVAIKINNDGKE